MKKNFLLGPLPKMEDFDLLENLLQPAAASTAVAYCEHEHLVLDKNMYVCSQCGFSEKVKDGQTYVSHKVYKRGDKEHNISASLTLKGFDSEVISTANKIYNCVVDESVRRTGNKSSIICACVFQAFKIHGEPVDYVQIYEKYGIKRKSALKGLKIVNAEVARRKDLSFHEVILSPIVPENFISNYMTELKANEASLREVLTIYNRIKTYEELDMSRPQSIAAGVIFYWLKKRGTPEAMKIVEEQAKLSQLTISKKAKIVALKIEQLEASLNKELN